LKNFFHRTLVVAVRDCYLFHDLNFFHSLVLTFQDR
jgi:hypothetical protein